MKKYKNVKAIKAERCVYYYIHSVGATTEQLCLQNQNKRFPKCDGYKCKCTEYKYKRGELL